MKFLILFTLVLLASCKSKPEIENSRELHSPRPAQETEIIIETNMGTIRAQLHEDSAPISVANFLSYVDEEFYDNTIFHRVISNFMIQGGGFELSGTTPKEKKSKTAIKNESKNTHKNTRGTLAMARTQDPHSATNQFFINVQDNPSLDYPNHNGGYAVFGEVTDGMDIVDLIKEVPTHSSPMLNLVGKLYKVGNPTDVPVKPVVIQSIRRATSAK